VKERRRAEGEGQRAEAGKEAAALPMGWNVATLEDVCTVNPKHESSLDGELEVTFLPMFK
jgi:hypothetical protein